MTWFPIGPDFIYTPRDTTMSPPRISRRNMYARQTQIWNIAVDPSDPNTLYTVDQDTNISPVVKGGAVGHCTDDGGKSWTSITDSLQANFTFTPTCFAVHPLNSNYVYMGTNTGAFYVSSNKGQQWGAPAIVTNGPISQIVVDPRNAISPATTIYVGTGNSLFVSTTGGASFGGSPVLAGTISSLAFSLFAGGADCYAGVR